uniref:Uncharacterized protein n=1 Tax=Anopheles dirus TaxID=7168 RepID=A0A182NAM1_9DIPT
MPKPSGEQTQPAVSTGPPTFNDWKVYFTNMQKAPIQKTMVSSDSSSSESSFELDKSFNTFLERKRQELLKQRHEARVLFKESDDVASRDAPKSPSASINDSTFLEQDSISKVSDTSFEEMERICAVLDKVNGFGTEIGTVDGAIGKPPAPDAPIAPPTLGDVTQLEDIDEPSGLWENTIFPGVMSPVKRMHLLRPSTILEETAMTTGSAEASKNSSIDTFVSAKQANDGSELENRNSAISGSDVYRTAQETLETDSYARSSILDMDSGVTSDITSINNGTSYALESESGYSKNTTREADESVPEEQRVIILDSSEDEGEEEDNEQQEGQHDALGDTYPLDSMLDDRDADLLEHAQSSQILEHHEESTDDYPEMSVLDEVPDRFNDTLEETDFMLKQGMKLMALKKQQQEEQVRRKEEEQHSYLSTTGKSRTNSDSDDGARPLMCTPVDKDGKKGAHSSYLTPSSGMRSQAPFSHGTGGFKQALFSSAGKTNTIKHPNSAGGGAASAGSFKKPISRLPHLKVPTRKFDHIISPISAYIKKTPQSMLQTKITCHNKNLSEVLHNENRDSVMSSNGTGSKENYGVSLKGYTSSLPGKGVISSNRAHVLDERNVVRIPGGEKMQKLINNSPTMIIRHEGRIKYAEGPAGGGGRKIAQNVSALGDESLADLSVLSSDVMRYGRTRLPELLIATVFGVGGGFYVFMPTFRQLQQERTEPAIETAPKATPPAGTMSLAAISRMYQMLKGSPVAVIGGTILLTGSLLYTYRAVYSPFMLRRDRAQSEAMADYIFHMEQSRNQRQPADGS